MYFYSDTAPRNFSDIDVWRMNGSKKYLEHFSNYLFLIFVSKRGTRAERASVEQELLICEKKLKFWERHPRYEAAFVQREKEKLIKAWRQDASTTSSGTTSAP
uniref:hypothetical protein n=1 Tax=Sinorhizobium sp. LM21 TaxID=1449788 RepID=UPI00117BC098|nr:hypothetical protein [Sinorhizobium sp. LM21]